MDEINDSLSSDNENVSHRRKKRRLVTHSYESDSELDGDFCSENEDFDKTWNPSESDIEDIDFQTLSESTENIGLYSKNVGISNIATTSGNIDPSTSAESQSSGKSLLYSAYRYRSSNFSIFFSILCSSK